VKEDIFKKLINVIILPSLLAVFLTVVAIVLVIYVKFDPTLALFRSSEPEVKTEQVVAVKQPEVVDGVHVETGLKDGNGLDLVIRNCTNCHSAKLITQNRMTAEKWRGTIKWMQETQNLWDLGKNEDVIVAYLAENYAPERAGRRMPLTDIEWYKLD
jgi:hypothetical protein